MWLLLLESRGSKVVRVLLSGLELTVGRSLSGMTCCGDGAAVARLAKSEMILSGSTSAGVLEGPEKFWSIAAPRRLSAALDSPRI